MKKYIIALLLFTLLPLSAHAGFFGKEEWEKEDCPKNHSLAWCIADYQGNSKGIHDMTKEEFVAALAKAGINDETQIANILHSSLGVATGVGNFALGNLLGGGVFMLHALMPGEAEQNQRDMYMVILDERIGRSKKQMAEDFTSINKKAVISVLPLLENALSVSDTGTRFSLTSKDKGCIKEKDCFISYAMDEFGVSPEVRMLPKYLGEQPVVSTKYKMARGIVFNFPTTINRADMVMSISRQLPDWVYWFIPKGQLGSNPFPMVLNKGNALFFVKPDPNDPVPVMPHIAAKLKNEEKSTSQTAPDTPSAPGIMQTSSASNQAAATADQAKQPSDAQ